MHTKDQLAAALTGIDAPPDMIKRAVEGYYHDFLSPLDFPEIQLVDDLGELATSISPKAPDLRERFEAITALRQRVIDGDFDASLEESEEWAKSPEGQDAMNRLVSGK